jgi:hypothetical protein
MATFSIIAGGMVTTFPRHEDLVDGSELAWVEGEAGVGMAPVGRDRQQGPQQHGAANRGFRLLSRTFTLIFGMRGATLAELYDKRAALLELCAPTDTPLTCRWELDNGAVRQLEAYYASDLAYPSQDRMGFYQRVGVGFEALDPTFYDPTGVSVSFGIAASANSFTVPLAIPWAIGASTINQAVSVAYPGSWRASPTITIVGPITNPIVRNVTTGEKLDFTGITVAAGDSYVIDTRYSVATVTDAAGVDRTANLTDDSHLTTFHLASRADVPGGVNDLSVTGTAATAATQVYVQFYPRYLGL